MYRNNSRFFSHNKDMPKLQWRKIKKIILSYISLNSYIWAKNSQFFLAQNTHNDIARKTFKQDIPYEHYLAYYIGWEQFTVIPAQNNLHRFCQDNSYTNIFTCLTWQIPLPQTISHCFSQNNHIPLVCGELWPTP